MVVMVVMVVVAVVVRLRRKSRPTFRTKQTNKLTAIGEKSLSTIVKAEEICYVITYVITEGEPWRKVPQN